jgi:hypothetical protein
MGFGVHLKVPCCLAWAGWMGWLALAGGCAVPAKPLPLINPAETAVTVGHYYGTVLSGTVLKPPRSIDPGSAVAVEVSFVALERLPNDIDPLGSRARLIVASHAAEPVRSTGSLTRLATYGTGGDAVKLVDRISRNQFGRIVELGHEHGALPLGVTARFEITDSSKADAATTQAAAGHRRFEVQICRPLRHLFTPATAPSTSSTTRETAATEPATLPSTEPVHTSEFGKSAVVRLEMAVVLDDDVADQTPASESSSKEPATLHMETVLLDPVAIDLDTQDSLPTAVIVVPFRFRDGHNQAVAAEIRIGKPSAADLAFAAVCEDVSHQLAKAYVSDQSDFDTRPPASPDEATIRRLLPDIMASESRREALAYLAAWSGAEFCEDAALSCDDQMLGKLADLIVVEVGRVPPTKPAVGWRMEIATLGWLTQLLNDDKLPPELQAMLVSRTGEAGMHGSTMDEILKDVRGPVDFDERLVAFNRLYLEDTSPASRARAYDWLKNRDHHEEPAGYSALASSRDRRAALERDAEQRAAALATQPSVPSGVAP